MRLFSVRGPGKFRVKHCWVYSCFGLGFRAYSALGVGCWVLEF